MVTHKGCFKPNRLPFGFKLVPSLFQEIIDTKLAELEFTVSFFIDILVKNESNKLYKEHIEAVFQIID